VVLSEVYRGDGTDVQVDRLLSTVRELPLTRSIARLAGQLRATAGTGSGVDAMVAATAVRAGGGLVATGDPDDLEALTAAHPNVKVWRL
jgi:predicted nucleic acid-binding protein